MGTSRQTQTGARALGTRTLRLISPCRRLWSLSRAREPSLQPSAAGRRRTRQPSSRRRDRSKTPLPPSWASFTSRWWTPRPLPSRSTAALSTTTTSRSWSRISGAATCRLTASVRTQGLARVWSTKSVPIFSSRYRPPEAELDIAPPKRSVAERSWGAVYWWGTQPPTSTNHSLHPNHGTIQHQTNQPPTFFHTFVARLLSHVRGAPSFTRLWRAFFHTFVARL